MERVTALVMQLFCHLATKFPTVDPERLVARARYLADGFTRGNDRYDEVWGDTVPGSLAEAEKEVAKAIRAANTPAAASQADDPGEGADDEPAGLEAILAGNVKSVLEYAEQNPGDVGELLAIEESQDKPRGGVTKGLQKLLDEAAGSE